jgi:hypothetical protein
MDKSNISFQDKINELRLDISHPHSRGVAFIFLEGDKDVRLFRKLFNLEKCKVENIPGGNPKLEKCVEMLLNVYPLIIGIRDADFIHLEEIQYVQKNMFLTDFHDIEITMLNHESVLNALIFEFSDLAKGQHIQLKEKIIESISLLSCFKWLNWRERLELDLTSGFQDLISFVNLTIDLDQYISRAISKSSQPRLTDKEQIIEKVNELKNSNPNMLQVTNGHDLLNALAKYFREINGQSRSYRE